MKVLMICLGNICRSPMAEGILRDLAAKNNLLISTDSCGTNGLHDGEKPDSRGIICMNNHGIDISDLRSRKFNTQDFDEFDHLFVMDASNKSDILNLTRTEAEEAKVKLFMNLVPGYENTDVPDPYYGGDEGFEKVYNMLNKASINFINSLNNE